MLKAKSLLARLLALVLAVCATALALFEFGPAGAAPAQQSLDGLFAKLRASRTDVEAGAIQAEIKAAWKASGTDTGDLLMIRIEALSAEGDTAYAIVLADAVVDLYPEFAEGWVKRAQLRIQRDEGPEANRDLLRALQIEPRHFTALEILGGLYEAQQEQAKALETYRQYLAINPLSDSVRQKVTALERRAAGQDRPTSLPETPAPPGAVPAPPQGRPPAPQPKPRPEPALPPI